MDELRLGIFIRRARSTRAASGRGRRPPGGVFGASHAWEPLMSSHSSALGEALLSLPEPWAAQDSAPVMATGVRERLSLAHSHTRQQALAGEEIFRVALALQDGLADDLLPSAVGSLTQALHNPELAEADPAATALAQAAGGTAGIATAGLDEGETGEGETPGAGDAVCVATLRAQAVSLVAAGDIAGAVAVLCALLDWPMARSDALLGLAICAVRLERHDAALALARDHLKRGGKHPRAHCIAGVCLLRRGDRRDAQNHLAIAARAARADSAFRNELRAAQRLLIMLNFGR